MGSHLRHLPMASAAKDPHDHPGPTNVNYSHALRTSSYRSTTSSAACCLPPCVSRRDARVRPAERPPKEANLHTPVAARARQLHINSGVPGEPVIGLLVSSVRRDGGHFNGRGFTEETPGFDLPFCAHPNVSGTFFHHREQLPRGGGMSHSYMSGVNHHQS